MVYGRGQNVDWTVGTFGAIHEFDLKFVNDERGSQRRSFALSHKL